MFNWKKKTKEKKDNDKYVEFEFHEEDYDFSGYNMFVKLCKKLDQIYDDYEIIDREDFFRPSKFLYKDEETKEEVYSHPEIYIYLKCKTKTVKETLYVNKTIYEYGNGIYAKPLWQRYQEKITEIEKEYIIETACQNYIPEHCAGGEDDHYPYYGPTVCSYLLCKKRGN